MFENSEEVSFFNNVVDRYMDSCPSKKTNLIEDFQSIIFSPCWDQLSVKEKIEEIKDFFSPSEIDHQLILAFSLDYAKIPIFKSLLSKLNLEEKDFIHFDQELLFHLLQSNISFPLSVITKNVRNTISGKLQIEQYLYEEIEKKFEEEDNEEESSQIKIRKKMIIEEIIEKDDIESIKILSNSNNFD